MDAGSVTSNLALRVVEVTKINPELGDITRPPHHGWWSLETERVKQDESCGTQTRKVLRWSGSAEIVNNRTVLSSKSASNINKPAPI
jgi:hypothetical protein